MVAAHIVPRSLSPAPVDYVFGKGSSSRVNTADNYLFIHVFVERSLERGNFVLLPVAANEKPIKRWKVHITNTAAINNDLSGKTLKELDGNEVAFKTDGRPASRFLYYHFVISLLRNKRDRQPGWEKYMVGLLTGRPFATKGKYLRQSMQLTLAKHAGDLDKEEEASLLGDGGETFVEGEKLDEKEEGEIAKQILAAHDWKEVGDDEKSGDLSYVEITLFSPSPIAKRACI